MSVPTATIKNKLRRAFKYFGETDAEILEMRVTEQVELLQCIKSAEMPETIETASGPMTGYMVDIISNMSPEDNKMFSLKMIITIDNMLYYLLNTYTVNRGDNWESVDDNTYSDETYKIVELNDVPKELFVY